jgi:hypothetical protein
MSPTDDHAPKTRIALRVLVVCVLLLGVFISFLTISTLQPPVLSTWESRLVGDWQSVETMEGQEPMLYNFGSDHVFRCSGGLIGRWWVENGQLHLTYWRDEKSYLPFADVYKRLLSSVEAYDLKFEDDDRVGIALPAAKEPARILVRQTMVREHP